MLTSVSRCQGRVRRVVAVPAPEIDHELAVEAERDGGAELLAAREALLEDLADRREARIAVSFDDAHAADLLVLGAMVAQRRQRAR